MKHNVGDVVWYVPGYRGSSLIAIKCKITSCIGEYGSVYDMDIPVGHSVAAEELFTDEVAAKNEVLERYQQELLSYEQMMIDDLEEVTKDLQNESKDYLRYFLDTVGFICGTHDAVRRWTSFKEYMEAFPEDHETINVKQAMGIK